MSPSFQLNPSQIDFLLKTVGKQLNTNPDQLKSKIESGNINGIANSIGGEAGQKLQQVLNSPQQLQAIMNSPDMQKLLASLNKNGK